MFILLTFQTLWANPTARLSRMLVSGRESSVVVGLEMKAEQEGTETDSSVF